MSSITFTVPGPPRGKGRPRFTRKGHAYTPEETATYENLVRVAYHQAAHGEKLQGPVTLTIRAFMPIPKSWSVKKTAKMVGMPHTSKPDCSNILKAVEDGLNGVAYADDACLWEIHMEKVYGDPQGAAGLEVTLETKEVDA